MIDITSGAWAAKRTPSGPLFNLKGEVIGINSQIYSRSGGYQGLSFAIPIDMVLREGERQVLSATLGATGDRKRRS